MQRCSARAATAVLRTMLPVESCLPQLFSLPQLLPAQHGLAHTVLHSAPLLPRRLILAKAREHPPASTARVWMKSAMVEREAGDAAAERSLLQVGWCRGSAMARDGWKAVGDGGCCCMWPAVVRNQGAVWVVRQELCSRRRAQGRSLHHALAHRGKLTDAVVP